MPLPNLSTLYQRIAKGSEGGNEFARIMNQLLIADAKDRNYEVLAFSDSSGDYKGVDCVLKFPIMYSNEFKWMGVQYKFCPSPLSASHKQDIKESLLKAIQKFPEMSSWVIVTPEDLHAHDMDWLDTLKKEFDYKPVLSMEDSVKLFNKKLRGEYVRNFFEIKHWGHAYVIHYMNEYPEIGKYYYPELFKAQDGKLVLCRVSIDSTQTNWFKSGNNNVIKQVRLKKGSTKSSELVFDFLFANNSPNINHLHQIDIVLERLWTDIKGIHSDELVKSIGTIFVDMDFDQKVTSVNLDKTEGGYLVFRANESRRFAVQLNQFAKRCHANMAELYFEFIFDAMTIRTETFTLDF